MNRLIFYRIEENQRLNIIYTVCWMQIGQDVQIVVMDMNPSFKTVVQQALNKPVIVAD